MLEVAWKSAGWCPPIAHRTNPVRSRKETPVPWSDAACPRTLSVNQEGGGESQHNRKKILASNKQDPCSTKRSFLATTTMHCQSQDVILREMVLDTSRKKTKPRHISIMDNACTISLTKKKISYTGTINKNSSSSGGYSDEEASIRCFCPPWRTSLPTSTKNFYFPTRKMVSSLPCTTCSSSSQTKTEREKKRK